MSHRTNCALVTQMPVSELVCSPSPSMFLYSSKESVNTFNFFVLNISHVKSWKKNSQSDQSSICYSTAPPNGWSCAIIRSCLALPSLFLRTREEFRWSSVPYRMKTPITVRENRLLIDLINTKIYQWAAIFSIPDDRWWKCERSVWTAIIRWMVRRFREEEQDQRNGCITGKEFKGGVPRISGKLFSMWDGGSRLPYHAVRAVSFLTLYSRPRYSWDAFFKLSSFEREDQEYLDIILNTNLCFRSRT